MSELTLNQKLMCGKNNYEYPDIKFLEDSNFLNFTKDELIKSIANTHHKNFLSLKRQLIFIYWYRQLDMKEISKYENGEIESYKRNNLTLEEYSFCCGHLFVLEEINRNNPNWIEELKNNLDKMKIVINNFRYHYIERLFLNTELDYKFFANLLVFHCDCTKSKIILNKSYGFFNKSKLLSLAHESNDSKLLYEILFRLNENNKEILIQELLDKDILTNQEIYSISKIGNREQKKKFILKNLNDSNVEFYSLTFSADDFRPCLENISNDKINILLIGGVFTIQFLYSYFYECGYYNKLDYIKDKYFDNKSQLNNQLASDINPSTVKNYIKYYISDKISINERIFCVLCESGYLEEAKEHLERTKISHTCSGWYPLIKACEAGQLKVAKWLYELGEYNLIEHNYMLYENVAFYGMFFVFEWMISIEIPPTEALKKIKRRCLEGKNMGSRACYVSKFESKFPSYKSEYSILNFCKIDSGSSIDKPTANHSDIIKLIDKLIFLLFKLPMIFIIGLIIIVIYWSWNR